MEENTESTVGDSTQFVFVGIRKGKSRFRQVTGTLLPRDGGVVFVANDETYEALEYGETLGRAFGNKKKRILNEISVLQTRAKELDRQYQALMQSKPEIVKE